MPAYLPYLIFGLLGFLFVYYILGRFKLKESPRLLFSFLGGGLTVVLAPFIFLTLFMGYIAIHQYEADVPFNQKIWDSNPAKRYLMISDLKEENLLIGKTKSEITQELGLEKNSVAADTLHYSLGGESHGFGRRFHYLQIFFEEDTVTSVEFQEIID